MRFGRKGKLTPRYVGPYRITQKVGKRAYRLALPAAMSRMHNVFHVSMLRKCNADPSQVIDPEPIVIQEVGTHEENPTQIVDRKEHTLRGKVIPLVKVKWQHHGAGEATWDREEDVRAKYPKLFESEENKSFGGIPSWPEDFKNKRGLRRLEKDRRKAERRAAEEKKKEDVGFVLR
ncbi:uncharacterized protein LOC122654608 [Telopea speciosissima]|uniref:uncharacterized protein LOC122654608 n=1 Tax=Telopea speciosissima TaxID=54955 RepID=UPI001CC786F8|nr:uncharacterized protein LOC122654608 [Telopea speciosissima]